jgi:preprotein translocase subunit SecB
MAPSVQQPTINIQVNVDAAPMSGGTDVEVTLRLEGKAESQGMLLFGFELVFAGVFRIQNVPAESLQPVVLIECPRLLFPFAREIIATAVRNGGFAPLLLDPIDFVGLYRQRIAAMQPSPPSQPLTPN